MSRRSVTHLFQSKTFLLVLLNPLLHVALDFTHHRRVGGETEAATLTLVRHPFQAAPEQELGRSNLKVFELIYFKGKFMWFFSQKTKPRFLREVEFVIMNFQSVGRSSERVENHKFSFKNVLLLIVKRTLLLRSFCLQKRGCFFVYAERIESELELKIRRLNLFIPESRRSNDEDYLLDDEQYVVNLGRR